MTTLPSINEGSNNGSSTNNNNNHEAPATIVISGAGIVGLVLALALQKHLGVTPEVYEKSAAFHEDVGAGMGLYPNGLRVLRDIDPQLVDTIKRLGQPYGYRRWERHDGTQVMAAAEEVLSRGDEQLESMGIRRWRLQKALYDAVQEQGIPVHFSKETVNIVTRPDGVVQVYFKDGTRRETQLLCGADGVKSAVRRAVTTSSSSSDQTIDTIKNGGIPSHDSNLKYTGVTCLIGIAEDIGKQAKGISFPSSSTTKCHGAFFPTGENEQCFQFHFPLRQEKTADQEDWGTLSAKVGREQCLGLAQILRQDGWHERYLTPLEHATKAIQIAFCTLQTRLDRWVYGRGRIILVGDACHPPVPYNGQGSQQGLEDAGTIAVLLKELCLGVDHNLILENVPGAMRIYEEVRIPRTSEILDRALELGRMQQKRAECRKYDIVQGEKIQRSVFYHETLPALLPGVQHDYKKEILSVLEDLPPHLSTVVEE